METSILNYYIKFSKIMYYIIQSCTFRVQHNYAGDLLWARIHKTS